MKNMKTIWKKIGLPNPPDNKNQYVLSVVKGKPIWLEVTTV